MPRSERYLVQKSLGSVYDYFMDNSWVSAIPCVPTDEISSWSGGPLCSPSISGHSMSRTLCSVGTQGWCKPYSTTKALYHSIYLNTSTK
jgi:hypothetical protein